MSSSMNYRNRYAHAPRPGPAFEIGRVPKSRVHEASRVPAAVIRYAFYAFVFSLPFESADMAIEGLPLSKGLGFFLVAVVLFFKFTHEPDLRLDLPRKQFWCFAGYFGVYILLGASWILSFPEDARLLEMTVQNVKTLLQLLILFWISYNLMRYEPILKRTLLVLTVSCLIVAILQTLDIGGPLTAQDRLAAFDANPNRIANIFALGLLTLVGFTYGRQKSDLKTRFVFWPCSIVFVISIVVTGSRGAMIALVLALTIFSLTGKSLRTKVKAGFVVFAAIGFLSWISYKIEPVWDRWEATYYEGDTAGRDKIFSAAWEMFLEKPLIGWGPEHVYELGFRLGLSRSRDTHNMYLWLLTETGLAGALPFIAGMWFCWHAGWKACRNGQGALAISLLVFIFVSGMRGTFHTDKLFWVLLAYAVANGSYVSGNFREKLQSCRPRLRRKSSRISGQPEIRMSRSNLQNM